MKLWTFGAIINTFVLLILFAIFLTVGGVGVDEFIGYFNNLGKAEETIRIILTTIKIDLIREWYYTLAGNVICAFLLFALVIYPLWELRNEDRSLSRPKMFLYTTVTFLSLPLGGGLFMLLSLSGLKNDILKEREEWLGERDMKKLMEEEYEESAYEERFVEYDSHQPSYDRNFERRTSTNEEITDAELDRRNLKANLIKLEDELDRVINNQVDRAREISLRRKLREVEYDLEDNAKYLERLKNRQLR